MSKQSKRHMGANIKSAEGVDAITVADDGRVGIGTNNPNDCLLDVSGADGVKIRHEGCTLELLGRGDLGYAIIGTDTNHPLLFRTNNLERMRLDANGKVQVNTGASGVTFETNTSLAGTISFCNGSGASAAPTVFGISNNNTGLSLSSSTNNANTNGDMFFNVREINNTDFSTTTSAAFVWRRFATDLGACTRAGVWSKPGGGSWASLSDERLKHSIQDLGPGLPMITALRPVSFEWKDEKVHPLQSKKGFIAQEVEKVNPNWVQESARQEITVDGKVEEILNVKQVQFDTEFTAVLVKAIQELKAELDEAKAEIAALRKQP